MLQLEGGSVESEVFRKASRAHWVPLEEYRLKTPRRIEISEPARRDSTGLGLLPHMAGAGGSLASWSYLQ
jgi:hypothetical protein